MGQQPFFSLDGPLDSMPTNGQMRIANLAGFPALVRSMGADPRAIMERHNINPLVVRDPDYYVECQSYVDLLEYCSTTFNQSLFGLRLAQLQDGNVFGAVSSLCCAAATVREAVTSFINYIPVVHSPTTILELVEGNEIAEIRWGVRSNLGNNQQANYQAALIDTKFLQLISGGALKPSYISLAVDARQKDIPELEKNLGCKFNKTQTENAIAFSVGILDQPVPSSSRVVFKLLSGYLDQVQKASRISIPERVEDFVRGSLAFGNCSIERCAGNMNMSVRSLQSHLSESGIKFSDIQEKERLNVAVDALKNTQLSLDDVATKAGYSELSSFGRAFKRWTGMTANQYRQSHRDH